MAGVCVVEVIMRSMISADQAAGDVIVRGATGARSECRWIKHGHAGETRLANVSQELILKLACLLRQIGFVRLAGALLLDGREPLGDYARYNREDGNREDQLQQGEAALGPLRRCVPPICSSHRFDHSFRPGIPLKGR